MVKSPGGFTFDQECLIITAQFFRYIQRSCRQVFINSPAFFRETISQRGM